MSDAAGWLEILKRINNVKMASNPGHLPSKYKVRLMIMAMYFNERTSVFL